VGEGVGAPRSGAMPTEGGYISVICERGSLSIIATLIAACAVLSSVAEAAEIRVISTRATEEFYRELVPQFERASKYTVTTTFTGTQALQQRIASGETYDVIIMIDAEIDAYIRAGKVVPGSRVDVARATIGAGVRAGLPKPDIRTANALKQALLDAKSIGYSTGPSGDYVLAMFARLGIADAVRPKLKQAPSTVLVASIIASGEAELGFQQANELSHYPGVDYLGPLPPELQETTWRSGGIMTGSRVPEAGRALLEFISSPSAAPIIRKHGLDPK
jgi:molybdate transport system substrate-binding protein